MFHCFGKVLEVVPDETVPSVPRIPIGELKPSDILAGQEHFQQLKSVFVLMCMRIVTKRIPELKKYSCYITKHLKHKYSDVLKHASVTVIYFVIPAISNDVFFTFLSPRLYRIK